MLPGKFSLDHLNVKIHSLLLWCRKWSVALRRVTLVTSSWQPFSPGFLWFSSMGWHLSVDSFHFNDFHVAIFLEKRKNDQFHEGSWAFAANCSTSPCPVKIIEKFLRIASHSKGSPLFWHVLNRKEAMSHSREKEMIKKELGKEGMDPANWNPWPTFKRNLYGSSSWCIRQTLPEKWRLEKWERSEQLR